MVNKIDINHSFKRVWSHIEPIRKFIIHHKYPGNKIFLKMVHEFDISMKHMVKQLTAAIKNDDSIKTWFYEKHRGKLIRIFDTFRGNFSKIYMTKEEQNGCQTEINALFIRVLKMPKFNSIISGLPTDLFTKFVRGITFFDHENDQTAHPMYHRAESCGVATLNVDEKFLAGDNKTFLRKCYIERLLYNMIYFEIFNMQDAKHLNELAWVQKVYEKHFFGEYIRIEVKFTRIVVPVSIKITWNPLSSQTSQCIETYRKVYDPSKDDYKPEVFCSKTCTMKNGKKTQYEKVQDFEEEAAWIVIS